MNKKMYRIKNRRAVSALLCLVIISMFTFGGCDKNKPNPEFVQVVNPIVEVGSLNEMEEKLDFKVPALDKEAETYIVLVIDGYPAQARIKYADGSEFDMKYGSGDVSGIYGGELVKEENIEGTKVSFMKYEDISYAIWEKDGFSYSLCGNDDLADCVKALIK